jgi:murein DD-endopeptidase MepM/ murein hydrolase activator NlpD
MISPDGVTRRDVILGGTAILALSSVPNFVLAQTRGNRLWMSGPAVQGGLVLARSGPGSRAWIDEAPVRVDNGLFCFGFGAKDEKPKSIRVVYDDGSTETAVVAPEKREYQVQRIDGLPEQYVSPAKELLERIARDAKVVAEARAIDTGETWFAEKFDWPADGPITGVYGSYRVLNGEPREAHYGTDIAAPEGSPIRAPAEGIVRMAEELYLSGNTLILDHGHGVSTSYLHMSRFDVKAGDHVKRGGQLGLIGKTGRATGPHLCWRMNWFQTRLDAALAAPPRSNKA